MSVVKARDKDVRALARILKLHVGRSSAVKASYLCRFLSKGATSVTVRACVHRLRIEFILPVCSDSTGYWVAATDEELDTCIESLSARAESITEAKMSLPPWKGNL